MSTTLSLNDILNNSISVINNAATTVNGINDNFGTFTGVIKDDIALLAPLDDLQFVNSVNVSGDLRLTAPTVAGNSKVLFEDVSANVLSNLQNI